MLKRSSWLPENLYNNRNRNKTKAKYKKAYICKERIDVKKDAQPHLCATQCKGIKKFENQKPLTPIR